MKRHRIAPGSTVHLDRFDPEDTGGVKHDSAKVQKQFNQLNDHLEVLQEKLWADHRRKVLVVLQGLDTSGKDGTIRHVFEGVNPLGVRVASFKAPTEEELAHDFLWRTHRQLPGSGEMVIFNRSHYEDVLAARV